MALTFANVALSHESPEELRAVVTVGRLVEVFLDEAVPVLVAQVVVFHGADEPRFNLHLESRKVCQFWSIRTKFWICASIVCKGQLIRVSQDKIEYFAIEKRFLGAPRQNFMLSLMNDCVFGLYGLDSMEEQ